MINAEEIARSTPRLEALIFSSDGYFASQVASSETARGVSDSYPGDVWHYTRNKIIIAACAAELDTMDGSFAVFSDPEDYCREYTRPKTLDASGKWAVHPSQIEIANRVFSLTQEEVKDKGLGAVDIDGDTVDTASVWSVRNTIQEADLACKRAASKGGET